MYLMANIHIVLDCDKRLVLFNGSDGSGVSLLCKSGCDSMLINLYSLDIS